MHIQTTNRYDNCAIDMHVSQRQGECTVLALDSPQGEPVEDKTEKQKKKLGTPETNLVSNQDKTAGLLKSAGTPPGRSWVNGDLLLNTVSSFAFMNASLNHVRSLRRVRV